MYKQGSIVLVRTVFFMTVAVDNKFVRVNYNI